MVELRVLALAAAALLAVAPGDGLSDADRDALRKAAQMPVLQMRAGVSLKVEDLKAKHATAEPDLAALEAALAKSPGNLEMKGKVAAACQATDSLRSQAIWKDLVPPLEAAVKEKPGDEGLRRRLSEALVGSWSLERAESEMRGIVERKHATLEDWHATAQILFLRASLEMAPGLPLAKNADDYGRILREGAASADGDDVLPLIWSGIEALDRALEVASEGPDAHLEHAGRLQAPLQLAGLLKEAPGGGERERTAAASILDAEIEDLRVVARLLPGDPRALVLPVMMALGTMDAGGRLPLRVDSLSLEDLPAPLRTEYEECAKRLEGLADSKDLTVAGNADLHLALLRFMVGGREEAERCLRRAVERLPGDDGAVEMLCGVLATSGRIAEMEPICRRRLEQGESWKFRLVLAKVLERLGRVEEAAKEAARVLAAEPERYEALLAVAALRLRRPMTAEEGKAVADLLDRAGKALGEEPDWRKTALVEFDRAILHGLEGRIKEARASLALAWEADSSLDVIEAVAAVLAE